MFRPWPVASAALMVVFLSGIAVFLLITQDRGDPEVLWATAAMLSIIPLGAARLAWEAHNKRNAHVELTDDAIVVRGLTRATRRVSTADLTRLAEVKFDAAVVARWQWPPWNTVLTQLPGFSGTALRIDLKRPIMNPWWALLRYRAIVIDPEDRPGFIAALRQVAPHVAIEPSLVE